MAEFLFISSLLRSAFFMIVGILGVGFLIAFHELGHFVCCKIFNIRTPSFSIGMGPRILTKKIGHTVFALSAIPLGGYVEIATEESKETEHIPGDTFDKKPYYQKMLVICCGIFFNILFAYCALSALYFFGMPKSPLFYPRNASTTISSIDTGSPASNSSLQTNDTITHIDNQNVFNKPLELIEYLKDHPNQSVHVAVNRNNISTELNIITGSREINNKQAGYLGVDFEMPHYPLFESIKKGIASTHTIIYEVWNTFKTIFSKKGMEKVGGPLMVISQTIKGAERGAKIFFLLLAFISINLAVLNVLPIPIMDGGQALFYTIEAIIRRPLPEKAKMYIHYACWIAMLLLALGLSVRDIMLIWFSQ